MAITFGYAKSSGGVRIFYACERRVGTPLLVVGRVGASTMMHFEPDLAFNRALAAGASWFMYDRRNTGRSTRTERPVAFDDMVDDLEAMTTLIGEPFDLYGRREGGQLGVALSVRRPEAVRRLLLVSTHRFQNDQERLPEYARRRAQHFEADPIGAMATHLVFEYPGTVPALALEIAKRHVEAMPADIIRAQDHIFDGIDLRDLGACCSSPALFLSQEHEIESLTLEAAGCLPCARVANWNQLGDGTINGAVWRRTWDETFPPGDTARPPNESAEQTTNYGLSARESEVLAVLCRGLSNAEIAATLVIAPSTANRHVANIFAKLGVASRLQAIALAYQEGLVSAPPRARRSVPSLMPKSG